MRNLYEILQVDNNADEKSIKKAYAKMIRIYTLEKNSKEYKEIVKAYVTLSDPARRKEYNTYLKSIKENNAFKQLDNHISEIDYKVPNGRIIGIDLGTIISKIAYIKDGKPEIIINNFGERITPSVVGINDDNKIIVGKSAKKQAHLNNDKTVIEVKKLMGTRTKITMGNKQYYPQEISARILKELKKYAEEYLGEDVTEAVITVSVNFNEHQRRATIEAGKMAGLKVERIINEPTAAALAYGINDLKNDTKVLVYDLGEGKFEVTVLELFEGILDVKASRGNNRLGGKDFDERIERYVIEDFKLKHGIDLSLDKTCLSRIKEASEAAKIELSRMELTEINIPFIAFDGNRNPLSVNIKLTRSKFEELISDLVNSIENQIRDTLKSAKYDVDNIDVVLGIGGESENYCVLLKLIQSMFKDKMKKGINPNEAVALGAAIQAGIKNDEISSENSVVLTNVCNHTLGIEVVSTEDNNKIVNGIYEPVILKHSKIPCTKKKSFCTVEDNQTEIIINVYQGEAKKVTENTKLGQLLIDGIPKGPAGKEFVEVEFTYNLNGMLELYAKVLSTGKVINKITDTSKSYIPQNNTLDSNFMNENKLYNTNTYNSNEENLSQNIGSSKLRSLVKVTLQLAENKLKTANLEDAKKIKDLIKNLKKAVINNDSALVEQYDDQLTDLLFDIN